MSHDISRRTWLAYGLGAAGLAACPGLAAALEDNAKTTKRPDRSKEAPSLPVGVLRCESYEPQLLRTKLDEAFKLIGGIRKLVEGKSVAVKINVTGGPGKLGGLPAHRTYHVHPNMVAALCAALHDAGARRIELLEGHYSLKRPEDVYQAAGWDIQAIASAGGNKVTWEDTRNRGRWPKYSRLTVPWGGFIYPAYEVNQSYEKTDVYISLAKLKDHGNAGVTMACKNNFGVPPTALYGDDAPNESTTKARNSTLHFGKTKVPSGVPAALDHGLDVGDWKRRVPRVTADVVGIRPIDLSVIDGIETNRGGEGPWVKGVEPLQPKLILVGRNPVCTDAVCTAVMGYDPEADHFQFPFQGENHLKLLAEVGVGTIDLKRIEVCGLSVKEALYPFNPRKLSVPLAQYCYYQHLPT